jgi:hypothetical protein
MIHVSYGFFDDQLNNIQPPDAVAKAFKAAIDEWNAKKTTTGVVFDPGTPGQGTNVRISLSADPARTGGCVQINFHTGDLAYTSDWATLAGKNPSLAAGAAKHELGHYLGLDEAPTDASPPTVMNQAIPPCSNPTMKTTTIQDSDASVAKGCVEKAKQLYDSETASGGGGDYQIYGWASPSCIQWWDAYDVYYWNDGWHYIGTVYMRAELVCF